MEQQATYYEINVTEVTRSDDPVEPGSRARWDRNTLYEQRLSTLDLERIIRAVNRMDSPIARPRATQTNEAQP